MNPRHLLLGSAVCCILTSAVNPAAAVARAQSARPFTPAPEALSVWLKGRFVTDSYGELVEGLAKRKLVKFVAVPNDDGKPVEELLQSRGELVGGATGPALGRFLCEMNPHSCRSAGSRGAQEPAGMRWVNQQKTTQHQPMVDTAPGGKPICPSTSLPKFIACVPGVLIDNIATSISVPYTSGKDDLAEIVRAVDGCPTLNAACRQVIARLNKLDETGDPLAKYSGSLIVPAREYRWKLQPATNSEMMEVVKALDEIIAAIEKRHDWPPGQRYVYYTVDRPLKVAGRGMGLAPDEPRAALTVMSYPFGTAEAFANERFDPVVVGVWDTHVDDEHCGFKDVAEKAVLSVSMYLSLSPDTPPRFQRLDCGAARTPASLKWDHGTFVAGVIAARPGRSGAVGVNPSAKIWAYELPQDDLGDPIFALATAPGTPRMPDVINISSAEIDDGSSRIQSRLESLIRAKSNSYLFVAAADNARGGNPPRQFQNALCTVLPACLSLDESVGGGVISVVALDKDGLDRLKGEVASNYGTAFDVAAVGEALSTLDGNAIGTMRGTSVATPFVSGLASLLYARRGNKTLPSAIKDRIRYTSDFSETLDEVVRFGRINYRRALADLDHDVLQQTPSPGCDAPCRSIGVIRMKPMDVVRVEDGMIGTKPVRDMHLTLKASQIVRLARIADGSVYVVYMDNKVLTKIINATFDGAQVLQFKKKDGTVWTPIKINDIDDFTSSFARGENK